MIRGKITKSRKAKLSMKCRQSAIRSTSDKATLTPNNQLRRPLQNKKVAAVNQKKNQHPLQLRSPRRKARCEKTIRDEAKPKRSSCPNRSMPTLKRSTVERLASTSGPRAI